MYEKFYRLGWLGVEDNRPTRNNSTPYKQALGYVVWMNHWYHPDQVAPSIKKRHCYTEYSRLHKTQASVRCFSVSQWSFYLTCQSWRYSLNWDSDLNSFDKSKLLGISKGTHGDFIDREWPSLGIKVVWNWCWLLEFQWQLPFNML